MGNQQNISKWQVRQADESVRLFVYHYLQGDLSKYHPNVTKSTENISDVPAVIERTRNIIRLRHYSYRTETTYIDWINRFFRYIEKIKGGLQINENAVVEELLVF